MRDSKWMIGRVEKRFEELSRKGYDWISFYNGWLEGRFDMLKEREFPSITKDVAEEIDRVQAGMTPAEWRHHARCHCGTDLRGLPVVGYPHDGGYETPIGKYWLYILCPNCRYEMALWKLGIERGRKFEVV